MNRNSPAAQLASHTSQPWRISGTYPTAPGSSQPASSPLRSTRDPAQGKPSASWQGPSWGCLGGHSSWTQGAGSPGKGISIVWRGPCCRPPQMCLMSTLGQTSVKARHKSPRTGMCCPQPPWECHSPDYWWWTVHGLGTRAALQPTGHTASSNHHIP